MELKRMEIRRELQTGAGLAGEFWLCDVLDALPSLIKAYAGQAQMIYIDPPFATGKKFVMRARVGEKEWSGATPSLTLSAYADNQSREAYLDMMRRVLEGIKALLCDTGVVFVHVDYRMDAHIRLMMDEVFGENNLLNEIIWTYQTGGRAVNYFSRKHDVILFYRKTKDYYFDIRATGVARSDNRHNHMKKHVDADGRVYRSIRSAGKIYTYYDDEPVFPGDVWDDLSHLQQKDPQRTGYDTQKPLKLLERIVACSTRPNDLIMDLFAGSGTALVAARNMGRRFVGVDRSLMSMHVARRRLTGAQVLYDAPPCEGNPEVSARAFVGVGFYHIELTAYQVEGGVSARAFTGMDALDNWAVGYMREGVFQTFAQEMRTREKPALACALRLPVLTGLPVLRVGDVFGRFFYYALDPSGMQT